jgi:hypothetical protein
MIQPEIAFYYVRLNYLLVCTLGSFCSQRVLSECLIVAYVDEDLQKLFY